MGFLDKGNKRILAGTSLGRVLSTLTILFALYLITSLLWSYPFLIRYRGIFTSFTVFLIMIFYTFPGEKPNKARVLDYILALLSLSVGIYIFLNTQRLAFRVQFFDQIYLADKIFGIIMILLILEATRRVIGRILTLIAVIMLLYPFLSQYIPGMFHHRAVDFSFFIEHMFMTTNGIFGTPIGIVSSYVFMFVLFGAFLRATGAGDFFFDLARSIAGHTRGGLAKTAVIASALFGTISGSPVSNVTTTGAFTIPMMKRLGYPPHFAGAVETAASCGGTILPPVMGAVAFVMAEVIGVYYYQVAIAAVIPALLYYLAVFYGVDAEAIKQNLKGVSKSELPPIGPTLVAGLKYLIPLAWLIFRLLRGYSPTRIAFEAVLLMLILGLVRRDSRYPITAKQVLKALEDTINILLPVAIACAAAGIIVGVISLTGIGGKLTSLILTLAGGNLFAALILIMLITLILGMGMSITPSYILSATLAGPALIKAGVVPMAAHLFIVYFAAMATMTPPVCLSAYAAAGIAESDPMKVGYTAVRLGIVAFIIPYVFIYQPELILAGKGGLQTLFPILIITIGVLALAAGVNQHAFKKTQWWETGSLIAAGLLMFLPSTIFSLAGLVLFAVILLHQRIATKNF